MQNLRNADVAREGISFREPFGQEDLFRAQDTLKPGGILETEVEVLGFGSNPPEVQASPDQYSTIGKAIIKTSVSRHWEATIELMQANANNRFLNMQIFAELLRYICKICIRRGIGHLAIVDIGDASQKWYRDFFRLAGFSRCCCQSPAGSALQLENWNCINLKPPDRESSSVYEGVKTWLAEGRCTQASLLDSVASGEAAEVESRYFQELLTEFKSREYSQSRQLYTEPIARVQTGSQRRRQDSKRKSTARRKRSLQPGTRVISLRKHRSNQHTVLRSMEWSVFRVVKEKEWSGRRQKGGFWRTRKAHNQQRC